MPTSPSLYPLPSRVCGPLCGLCGFAVAMASGLMSSGEASGVVTRAMISCLGCYGLGLAAGHVLELVAHRVVERERVSRGVAERGPGTSREKTSAADL